MSFLYYLRAPAKRNLPQMSSVTEGKPPSPEPIFEAVWGFAVTRVLTTAVDLDVFTAIARGHHTVDDLVKDRSCSKRGLAMLLHALTALKYLVATSGGYSLSPVSAAFLSKASPHYIGAYLLHNTHESWFPWAQLADVVRGGRPARQSVHGNQPDAVFFSQLVENRLILASQRLTSSCWATSVTGRAPCGHKSCSTVRSARCGKEVRS